MGKYHGKGKLIYFGEDEWVIVEKKANEVDLNTSNYIKRMAVKGYIIEYKFEAINDLIYELNKIGVNINQLTKKANEIDNIYKEDVEELQVKMDEVWKLLKSYLRKIN